MRRFKLHLPLLKRLKQIFIQYLPVTLLHLEMM
jgi:hypothetical protein